MQNNIQRAAFWKRLAAWMFDGIITVIIAAGVAFLLSNVFGYDNYNNQLMAAYEKYETKYGIKFDITAEAYAEYSEEERNAYDTAYSELISDEEAVRAYSMTVNLSLVITTLAILVAIMIWEFVLPLILGSGQTLGKKIFGICLIKANSVKINNMQLLVRSLLGKFTLETMIPAYVGLMIIWESLNLVAIVIAAIIFVVQAVLLIVNENKALIHDLLAGTIVVDAASTRIFDSEEELLEYKKLSHAEEVKRKAY